MELSYKKEGRLASLGGGLDPSLLALRLLGMQVVIVDDYSQPYYAMPDYRTAISTFEERGVRIVRADLLTTDFGFLDDATMDCINSFDCLEHLHHSPKAAFERAVGKLVPRGKFILGVPNAVNALKRLRVVAGRSNLESAREFYFHGVPYTGHVREWTASELLGLASWLKLDGARVVGRNWLGHVNFDGAPSVLRNSLDRLLRLRPSLCSDLYLMAVKPAAPGAHGA